MGVGDAAAAALRLVGQRTRRRAVAGGAFDGPPSSTWVVWLTTWVVWLTNTELLNVAIRKVAPTCQVGVYDLDFRD